MENETVGLQTRWFGLNLSGKDAGYIFLFIAVLGIAGLNIYQMQARSEEHNSIICMIKLNLFVNQQPRGEVLDWQKMPVDLYSCVPKFLYDRGNTR